MKYQSNDIPDSIPVWAKITYFTYQVFNSEETICLNLNKATRPYLQWPFSDKLQTEDKHQMNQTAVHCGIFYKQ